jgi:hypothetical protein
MIPHRLILTACAFAAVLPRIAHAEGAPDALAPPIAQCIDANAAKVEATIDDLSKATDFLVSDVCAESVAAEQARMSKAQMDAEAAQTRTMCEESKKHGGGEKDLTNTYCTYVERLSVDAHDMSYTIYAPSLNNAPAAAIALAAKRLLDLRLSHTKTRASGG